MNDAGHRKLPVEFDEKHYKLLVMFAKKDILTDVDPALRRAVNWMLKYEQEKTDKLVELHFREATRKYWRYWEYDDGEDE